MSCASSSGVGSRPITAAKVFAPTSGSVIPASVNSPMSAGIPYSSSNACFHATAPAPPVETSVPSMSNSRMRWRSSGTPSAYAPLATR